MQDTRQNVRTSARQHVSTSARPMPTTRDMDALRKPRETHITVFFGSLTEVLGPVVAEIEPRADDRPASRARKIDAAISGQYALERERRDRDHGYKNNQRRARKSKDGVARIVVKHK